MAIHDYLKSTAGYPCTDQNNNRPFGGRWKMKRFFVLLVPIFLAFPANAQSVPTGPYIGGAFGMSGGSELGAVFAIQAGYKWPNGWRPEFEYRYVNEDFFGNDNQWQSHNFLGNVWYDFDAGSGFVPYIGGGIGFALLKDKNSFGTRSEDETVFSAQLGAGLQYAVSGGFVLDLGYRMLGQDRRGDNISHGILLGAKFHF